MAARENQGLQIALIIFVMLTIMLSVTTFIFFRNFQFEQQRYKEEQTASTKLRGDVQTLQSDRAKFVQYLGGYSANEKEPMITENLDKDMKAAQALGVGKLPEEQRNYRKLVDSQQSVIRAKNTELSKQAAELRDAKDTLAKKTADFAADRQKLETDKENAVKDYLAARDQIQKQLTDVRATEGELTAQNAAKAKELESVKSQAQAKIGDLEKVLTKAQTHVTQLQTHLNEVEEEFNINAVPQGKITWVNQRDGIAYINLGSDDRLHKRVTFSVYDPITTDVSAHNPTNPAVTKAVPKGSIEVINIIDQHTAECRILKDSPSHPLLPGDIIYTPAWRPGQQDHFALAGAMDLNGNGVDDRQRLHDLIAMNGGIIDAEVGPDGKPVGKVTLNTRYMVVGDLSAGGKSTDGSYKLLDEAKKLNIETITLTKFLDMIGYSPKVGSATLTPEEVIKAPIPGTPARGFRPRMPTAPPPGG